MHVGTQLRRRMNNLHHHNLHHHRLRGVYYVWLLGTSYAFASMLIDALVRGGGVSFKRAAVELAINLAAVAPPANGHRQSVSPKRITDHQRVKG